ncbi:MAG: hypothetical protein JWO44_1157 [Bacteroidetes bacterium]|nr:hypothetical protein [Bacteroidota bacterium]
MKKIILFFLLAISQLMNAQCLNGAYTIGGTAPDYTTITSAVSALTANGVCGPVVFNIRSGIYAEQVIIPAITGSSASNTITFQSEALDSTAVTVQASGSFSNNSIFKLNGVDYVKFYKLKVKNTATTFGCVFMIQNSSDNNTISNCIIENLVSTATSANRYLVNSGTDNENISITNNYFLGGTRAVNFTGTFTVPTSFTISGNKFQNQFEYGVFLTDVKSPKITGNVFSYSTALSSYAIRLFRCNDSTVISNNRITLNGGTGMSVEYCTGLASKNILIANNVINGSASSSGIGVGNSYKLGVYHNTVVINGTYTGNYCMYGETTDATDVVKNNIFYQQGIGKTMYTLLGGTFTSDYNDMYSLTAAFGYFNGTTCNTFSDWQTITGMDAHSLNIIPQFVSSSDLHISTDFSQNLVLPYFSAVPVDMEGTVRDISSPYFGAYEFFNVPIPDDASVSQLLSPAVRTCQGIVPVRMLLKNYGINNLTSATINWSVNGAIQPSYSWTGNLNFYDSTSVIIGSWNFSNLGSYAFKVWSSDPNASADGFVLNDTLTAPITYSRLNGVYTVGGASPDFINFNAAVSALTVRGVCGPVTFNVRNGTYYEQLNIPLINGVSAVNRVTFQSESGINTAVVLNNNVINNTYTLYLNGSDDLEFKNMTITGTNGNSNIIVRVENGSDNNLFYNNKITGWATYTSFCISSGSSGATNNNHNQYIANDIYGGTIGLNIEGQGSVMSFLQTGTVISGNTFHDQLTKALQMFSQDSLVVSSNTFTSSTTFTQASIFLQYYNYTSFIKNRISASNSGLSLGSALSPATAGVIANNFIDCSGSASIVGLSTDMPTIYNNSINITNTNAASIGASLSANVNFKNNIVVNSGGGFALAIPASAGSLLSNNNDLYVTGAALAKKGTATYATLPAWNAATSLDANSVSFNPMFMSTSNLHVLNPALANAGASVAGIITDDIDGDLRNLSTPGIGADEIVSSAKDILTFNFNSLVPAVTGVVGTNTVSLTVPYGTDVTALVATFTNSSGSSVKIGSTPQLSGTTANDFTNPVNYTVTAADMSTKVYVVTVTFAPALWYAETSGVPNNLHSVHFITANSGWTVGTAGTILHTANGGASWVAQNSGVTKTLFSVRFTSATEGWAVGRDETILHTTNAGATWTATFGTPGVNYSSVFFISPTEGWIGGDYGKVIHTSDGGLTWTNQNTGFFTQIFSVYFTDANHGWAVGDDASDVAIKTVNGGLTWQLCYVGITCPLESVFFIDNNKGWVAGKFDWASGDGGDTFGMVDADAGTGNHMYGMQFINDTIGYCVGDTGLITKSVDGGSTWSAEYSGTSNKLYSLFIYSNGDAWTVGANGTILKNSPVAPVVTSDVWPGDANHDSVVTNYDLLPLGLYYSSAGAPRAGSSNLWQAWPAADWGTAQANGSDIKHADCNGDGIIDNNDTLAVNLNFSSMHALAPPHGIARSTGPDLYFTTASTVYAPGDWVDVDVMAGTSALPVSDLYGLGFNIDYDAFFVQSGTTSLSYPAGWLGTPGTDAVTFSKVMGGTVYGAATRTDHTNRDGYGRIATLRFRVDPSVAYDSVMTFSLSSYSANDSSGYGLTFNDTTFGIRIRQMTTGLPEAGTASSVSIYPNPYSDHTEITYKLSKSAELSIEVYNSMGQKVATAVNATQPAGAYRYEFSAKAIGRGAGVYFVKISIDGKVTMKRIVEMK